MIEIPESKTLALQASGVLIGKRIKKVFTPTSPHKFCWFSGDPCDYQKLFSGKAFTSAKGHGMFLDLNFEDMTLTVNDGTNVRYVDNPLDRPKLYQLTVEFDDGAALVFTVSMYGAIFAFEKNFDNLYYQKSIQSVSPLTPQFDEKHFDALIKSCEKDLSLKAFLATQQRIPGLGNGCLQDILLRCALHPKRKLSTLSDFELSELFYSVKAVLLDMTQRGGRDTERDLFGRYGNYQTLLSKKTKVCALCGNTVTKESYMGGSIYYCDNCQK